MTITYRSTRGKQFGLSFEEVVLGGLANDKGLFIPETIPQFTINEIEELRKLSFVDLAFEVISKFVYSDDIPTDILKDIIKRSFSSFRHSEITPTIKLTEFWVLELFHGPTFAFKDVALQFLGNVFEFFLTRGKYQNKITILGATSGDTGSAAIHGLRGKKNVNCFIMYPSGKVTEIQERQMTTIPDSNVHCISIDGNFDDAQAIVKAAFADENFRKLTNLGAINSINWARVLAQITYYFYSWLRVTDDSVESTKVSFAVPTGNFGDILAGYYAKKMGLPVDKLIVCTNENDVLHRFLETGIYKKIESNLTIAPSMDISVSSNFERYLFYLAGESSQTLASWMNIFESTGEIQIPHYLLAQAKTEFLSASSSKSDIIEAMKDVYSKEKYLVCPHTATAVVAVRRLNLTNQKVVCLATAHPAKFEEAVNLALEGKDIPTRPKELDLLFTLPVRSSHLPNSLADVEKFIKNKLKLNLDESSSTNSRNLLIVTSLALVASISLLVYQRFRK